MKPDSTRGILRPNAFSPGMRLLRHPADGPLGAFVDFFWSVEWKLEQPVHRETLPYPSVHLAVQPGRCGVFGPVRRKFAILLEGRSSVFAVKFRPGGFRPFFGEPVSRLTDAGRAIDDVFGPAGSDLEQAILTRADFAEGIRLATSFLLERLPEPDPMVETVNRVIDEIAASSSITRVDQLVSQFGIPQRTLQRIFSEYVGGTPKWVIQRYRLQEAAERLAREGAAGLSRLALELGYADQAHFARDFRSIIGVPPGEYARAAAMDTDR